MKTRLLKMIGMLTMMVGMMTFTSCEVEIKPLFEDEWEVGYENTRMLCSRTWEESWFENGARYTQRLDFYDNRTGRDYLRIEHRDGHITENSYSFEWKWESKSCIRMEYGYDDVSFLERIWIADNTLTGYLDDVEVCFKGRL